MEKKIALLTMRMEANHLPNFIAYDDVREKLTVTVHNPMAAARITLALNALGANDITTAREESSATKLTVNLPEEARAVADAMREARINFKGSGLAPGVGADDED